MGGSRSGHLDDLRRILSPFNQHGASQDTLMGTFCTCVITCAGGGGTGTGIGTLTCLVLVMVW